MRRMFNRLYDWVFYVSIQRDTPNRGRANQYRYPSPGSIYHENVPADYRTPFQQTHYNVRYADLTDRQRAEEQSAVITSRVYSDPVKRLVAYNFLRESDINNPTAVNQARNKFKSYYGVQPEKNVLLNDLSVDLPNNITRQSIQKWYQKFIVQQNIRSSSNQAYSQRGSVDNPDVLQFQSLDMFDAPHFMQNRIQNQYTLDQLERLKKADKDGLITKQGSANFWKALDDSNDPDNIRRVQGKIGDPNPNDFNIRNARVKFQTDKDGNVTNIQRVIEKK